MNIVYVLHKGPTLLGAYSELQLALVAQNKWCVEFALRFGRGPRLFELPIIEKLIVNGGPSHESFLISESTN